MKYALFNDDGVLSTCLIGGLHDVPDAAIQIDDQLFNRLIQETDGVWVLAENGNIIKLDRPVLPPDYPALIAAERYVMEGKGVTALGLRIDTTRDSQALIAGMAVSALIDPTYQCNFKAGDGFVELEAQQILSISSAVRNHVQACFDREKALLKSVKAGKYHDGMLTEGWPDYGLEAGLEPKPAPDPSTAPIPVRLRVSGSAPPTILER
jgi:hypothetical protein